MVKGDITFIYMSVVSGTFSAYFVSKANQRSKISLAGPVIGVINIVIVFCFGRINKYDWDSVLVLCSIVLLNGILSTMLTIGILPFLESMFNIVTPLKLLELANPNQPTLKKAFA
jgi:membrane-associated HD superfamily phosphohydrolase